MNNLKQRMSEECAIVAALCKWVERGLKEESGSDQMCLIS